MHNKDDIFRPLNALDKKYKPLILEWLALTFGYPEEYPHSFKDQWITWGIWKGELSVGFDTRVEEQLQLMQLIPKRFMGAIQFKTMKIVNEYNFYLNLDTLFVLKYPAIKGYKLLCKDSHHDGDGDLFYTYDWSVELEDGTFILYHNQKPEMDMKYRDVIYDSRIQERAFREFLEKSITLKR